MSSPGSDMKRSHKPKMESGGKGLPCQKGVVEDKRSQENGTNVLVIGNFLLHNFSFPQNDETFPKINPYLPIKIAKRASSKKKYMKTCIVIFFR